MRPLTVDDFWSRISMHPNGCWPWTHCKTDKGYGTVSGRVLFGVQGPIYAHRAVWAYIKNGGVLPPTSIDIHHRCENRICCNPHHLEALTESDHQKLHSDCSGCATHGYEFWSHGRCKVCRNARERERKARKKAAAVFHGRPQTDLNQALPGQHAAAAAGLD